MGGVTSPLYTSNFTPSMLTTSTSLPALQCLQVACTQTITSPVGGQVSGLAVLENSRSNAVFMTQSTLGAHVVSTLPLA